MGITAILVMYQVYGCNSFHRIIGPVNTYPCEEYLIKIEDAGVATTLKFDFSNIQGQLTPQSRVESGSNSNSSKMLWLSLLLPRMKIQSKLKALEWPQYKILIFQTLKGS